MAGEGNDGTARGEDDQVRRPLATAEAIAQALQAVDRRAQARHVLLDAYTQLQTASAKLAAEPSDPVARQQVTASLASLRQLQVGKRQWLNQVAPFVYLTFYMTVAVIVLPFLLILAVDSLPPTEVLDALVDWGKTVLPAVVGFASAAVGYLFGSGGDDAT